MSTSKKAIPTRQPDFTLPKIDSYRKIDVWVNEGLARISNKTHATATMSSNGNELKIKDWLNKVQNNNQHPKEWRAIITNYYNDIVEKALLDT